MRIAGWEALPQVCWRASGSDGTNQMQCLSPFMVIRWRILLHFLFNTQRRIF